MKKNFIQDVVPPNHKRSIRDIPLPSHKKQQSNTDSKPSQNTYSLQKNIFVQEETPIQSDFKKEPVFNSENFHTNQSHTSHTDSNLYSNDIEEPKEPHMYITKEKPVKNKKKAKTKIVFIFSIFVFIVLFLMIFGQSKATITTYAKQAQVQVNNVLPLNNPLVTQTQITKSVSRTVPATSEQQIEQVAQGQIRIINKHKETPQELVTNTRFQAPNGLIYRIRESIVVPGYTMNGSTIVPGTLDVTVYADSPGEEYNFTSKTNFTIPGFAGREQFEKIKAESIGEMSGGYVGIRKVVSEETKEQIIEELKSELENQFKNIQNESQEYVLLAKDDSIRFSNVKDEVVNTNDILLSLTATIDAYSLVKKDLYNFIGQNSISGAQTNDMFTIKSPESLTYSITNENITITGSITIHRVIDVENLKKEIAGKKRSEVAKIMLEANQPFENSELDPKPFWKSTFPKDIDKIKVIILE